jgi:hypothetical protein
MEIEMFEIVTPENSQHITLNDNAGRAPVEEVIIGKGAKAVGWAVVMYAKRYRISADRVGFAVRPVKPSEVRS